jgi:hypothetical protein
MHFQDEVTRALRKLAAFRDSLSTWVASEFEVGFFGSGYYSA